MNFPTIIWIVFIFGYLVPLVVTLYFTIRNLTEELKSDKESRSKGHFKREVTYGNLMIRFSGCLIPVINFIWFYFEILPPYFIYLIDFLDKPVIKRDN